MCRSLKQTDHASAVSSKIVGGRSVAPGSYTFVASLRRPYHDSAPGSHFCGGALISQNVVATAAHCLKWIHGSFPVHLGRHDRNGNDMGRFETFSTVKSIIHPQYRQGANANYDIALLVLNKKSGVQPVQLRTSDVCFEGNGCGFGEVFGWGWTETNNRDSSADSLMSVRVPLVSRAACRHHYGYSRITNAMVCAGGNVGQDACQGDSGGPLLVINKLSGLVSFGPNTCGTRHPGVYTNIALVNSWIQDQLRTIDQVNYKPHAVAASMCLD